jgi:hypothetical protein
LEKIEKRTLDLAAVLSNDPQSPSEHLARFDIANSLQQPLSDRVSELGELLDDLAHERDDVDGGRVAGVADELHQDVDDRGGHLGELDGA